VQWVSQYLLVRCSGTSLCVSHGGLSDNQSTETVGEKVSPVGLEKLSLGFGGMNLGVVEADQLQPSSPRPAKKRLSIGGSVKHLGEGGWVWGASFPRQAVARRS